MCVEDMGERNFSCKEATALIVTKQNIKNPEEDKMQDLNIHFVETQFSLAIKKAPPSTTSRSKQ